MTSKERVQAAISFQKPDRAPFNFWMDRRLMAQYEEELGPDYRVRHYGADVIETFPLFGFPYAETIAGSGTHWILKPLVENPAEANELPMPDPDADSVLDMIKRDRAEFPDTFIIMDVSGVLGTVGGIRRYENFFTDVYDYPEDLARLLDKISDIQARGVERAIDCGIDALYMQDDIGSTHGLMMSPEMVEEWVLSYNQKSVDIAKAAGLPVWYHSDGGVMDILDRLVERGINVVNPLEPHLNDLPGFREKYQKPHKLAAYGTLDTYGVIPSGTPDDVRMHVRSTFEMMNMDGALIFSTHDIPLNAPRENVDAMVDEIKMCRY